MLRPAFVLLLALMAPSLMANTLSAGQAQFLLSRTGFTPTLAEIDRYAGLSQTDAVSLLLDTAQQASQPQATGAFTQIPTRPPRSASAEQRAQFQQALKADGQALQQWWLGQMLATTTPLVEQMTLFWHNHFVSSIQKVKVPVLMYRQNQTFRELALGNYQTLVHEMAKTSAMILYLDGHTSSKDQPNENFARELFELFTLGEGHYSEQDVKAAAAAFTGWRVDPATGESVFKASLHDTGVKTLFGQQGNLNGTQVIDLIFEQKPQQVANHLITKLWWHFIGTAPDPAVVDVWSAQFVAADFELRPLIETLLLSPQFWAAQQPLIVKSPVDLVVGTQRVLGMSNTDNRLLRMMGSSMGQALFAPPNVKGWQGGQDWLTSSRLVARQQLMALVARSYGVQVSKRSNKQQPMPGAEDWTATLLPYGALNGAAKPVAMGSEVGRVHEWVASLLADPLYQLK